MNKFICCLVLHLLLLPFFTVAEQNEDWSLLMHASSADVRPLTVTPEQRQWLQHKRVLNVGVYTHDSPPFSLLTSDHRYEGLNAEYIGLIAAQLGLGVRFKTFQNPEQRLLALERGEIDVIPNSAIKKNVSGLFFTAAYAREHPIIAMNVEDRGPLAPDLRDVSVAMVAGYWPVSDLQTIYPHARFQVYDNYQEALSAVAFNRARVYFGNGYPVNRNFINNLRVERFASTPIRENSFALRQSHSPLTTLFNTALASITPAKRSEIQQLWQSDETSGLNKRIDFSPAEQRWIEQHPQLNVILYGKNNTAPVAFVDDSGNLRGIAADVLGLVSIKTGLKFNFKTAYSLTELEQQVNTGEADMVAALAPSEERSKTMLFTYPYVRTAFVLVTKKQNSNISRLSDLRDKKIGLVEGAALTTYIATSYPEINRVIFNNDADLFSSLEKGNVDAVMALLITSDYQMKSQYRDTLKIVNTVGNSPTFVSFGVGKSNPELQSILNKVLTSVPPDEIEMLSNRWRPNNLVVSGNIWTQHRSAIIAGSVIICIVLLLTIARTFWLRRKIINAATQLKMLENLIDEMPFPVTLRDLTGRLKFCNKLYLSLVGFSFRDIQGTLLTDQPRNISLQQATFFHEKAIQTINNGALYSEDLDIDLIDRLGNVEKSITANIWMLPWKDAAGNVIGIVGGSWDISERTSLLQKLRETSDRAEASNRAKSTFLSTMSHEIRTPMNAIIGMLDMAIKKGRRGDHDLQALEVAQESAEGLVGLIGDILDLSQVEEGDVEFRPVPINLATLINQLLVIFNGLAIDKNILLSRNLPTDDIIDVLGDPLRIKQVLSNLLGNAIKFTDTGGVTLNLRQEIDREHSAVHYVIDVIDSGVGIDEDQQAALFQPFAQADNRRAGTGLGLFISRNLCRTMGGDLTLSSVLHQGTRVRAEFSLPISCALGVPPNATEPFPVAEQQLNVLVVDDNAANRMLLAKQLAWLGHHAHIAEGGEAAIELWQRQKFDVIVTDCNMPRMNGYQFAEYIRQEEANLQKQPVWILGFTANAMYEVTERCLAAGMNGCLFKPCTINSLSMALNQREVRNMQSPSLTLSGLTSADSSLQEELSQRLEMTMREDFAAMNNAAEQQDWPFVAELAHRMLGSVRIVRERQLADACEQLESLCRSVPQNMAACEAAWKQLKIQIDAWLSAADTAD